MIKVTTSGELKELFVETLLNKTQKITKISDNSGLGAIGFGAGKIGQKALKDIALVKSHLYPDEAFGDSLDEIASNNGIAPRFTSSQSSTYVRLVADPGTVYIQGVHTFSGSNGIVFDLEGDITISDFGFAYGKIRSTDVGLNMNVDPLTINKVSPVPSGHKYVINEYKATGGRDNEQDDLFRQRIKDGPNILATRTIAMIEQVFIKLNPNVLRVFYHGINSGGQLVLAIATQNGINLDDSEIDFLLQNGSEYFSLTELRPVGAQTYSVQIINIDWEPIDISFRVELLPSYNSDDVRRDIQFKMSKLLDFRFWEPGNKVQWDDLLFIVKTTKGVKYVPDNYFFPNSDVAIDKNLLPRVRGFLMLDLNGSVLLDLSGNLVPTFYPNIADFSFQQTVLTSI